MVTPGAEVSGTDGSVAEDPWPRQPVGSVSGLQGRVGSVTEDAGGGVVTVPGDGTPSVVPVGKGGIDGVVEEVEERGVDLVVEVVLDEPRSDFLRCSEGAGPYGPF